MECKGIEEAAAQLKLLKTNTEVEEWAVPQMKRAVLTGVSMCIQYLVHSIEQCSHNEVTPEQIMHSMCTIDSHDV